jgi:hypothetical protein
MLVKMLSKRDGSPDGLTKVIYAEGETYDIHGDLLDVFLREGWCEAAEPFREGETEAAANTATGGATGESQEGGTAEGGQPGGEGETGDGSKEPELVLAEAEVLAKYTRDELLDLAEEQEIEVPADVVKKADVVKFLAGKLKVTVE